MNSEQQRLNEAGNSNTPGKKWGPYVSERQWDKVREDYSSSITELRKRVPPYATGYAITAWTRVLNPKVTKGRYRKFRSARATRRKGRNFFPPSGRSPAARAHARGDRVPNIGSEAPAQEVAALNR